MRPRLTTSMLALLAIGVTGCATVAPADQNASGSPSAPIIDAAHNSENSLDWAGTYRGVLPCADCEGIETVITLHPDGRYSERTRYLGRDSKVFAEDGTFAWDKTGGIITLSGEETARYRVGENRLFRLATDGTPVTGPLAGHYVLTKAADGITEKYWKLIELNGQPVPSLEREPHMILKTEDNRVTGYGGCNSFTGSYELDEAASRIRFESLATTGRACLAGMDVEYAFHNILGRVDNYSLSGDHLTLQHARMAPLARFEAVWLQ